MHEKEINGKRASLYYKANTEKCLLDSRKRNKEKSVEIKIYGRNKTLKKKKKVISHYSNGKMCCNICGETFLPMLQIDHINNDGNLDSKGGSSLYNWIITNNFPTGYQVLCAVCNIKKYWQAHKEGKYTKGEHY